MAGKIFPKFLKRKVLTENKISASDFSNKRYKDAAKSKPVDIMILGSSHAYRGYDVRLFNKGGYSSYNLGSSAQTLSLTAFIYNNFVEQLKPNKIIIDIYPLLLTKNGEEGELNLLPLFYKDISFIGNTFKAFDVSVLNSLIYFQAFGNPSAVKSKMSHKEEYIDGGYISSYEITKDSKKYEPTILTIEEKNINALKNIIADAEAKGIKVYLFQSPLPEERYKSFRNNKEIDSLMRSIGVYYNYNEVGFLPTEYFFDDSHINQKGVDVYNEWVIKKIKENE